MTGWAASCHSWERRRQLPIPAAHQIQQPQGTQVGGWEWFAQVDMSSRAMKGEPSWVGDFVTGTSLRLPGKEHRRTVASIAWQGRRGKAFSAALHQTIRRHQIHDGVVRHSRTRWVSSEAVGRLAGTSRRAVVMWPHLLQQTTQNLGGMERKQPTCAERKFNFTVQRQPRQLAAQLWLGSSHPHCG